MKLMPHTRDYEIRQMERVYRGQILPAVEQTDNCILDIAQMLGGAVVRIFNELPQGAESLSDQGHHRTETRSITGQFGILFPRTMVQQITMEDRYTTRPGTDGKVFEGTSILVKHTTEVPGIRGKFDRGESKLDGVVPVSDLNPRNLYTITGVGAPRSHLPALHTYGDQKEMLAQYADAYVNRLINAVSIGRMVLGVGSQSGIEPTFRSEDMVEQAVTTWRVMSPTVADVWTPYYMSLVAARASE
jgi:hypothetical protein